MFKQLLILATAVSFSAIAQDRRPTTPPAASASGTSAAPAPAATPKAGPKPYKEVITDKSKTTKGLFIVHKVDEKYFFELPDSLLGREIAGGIEHGQRHRRDHGKTGSTRRA